MLPLGCAKKTMQDQSIDLMKSKSGARDDAVNHYPKILDAR
jgi:hypothetical protein